MLRGVLPEFIDLSFFEVTLRQLVAWLLLGCGHVVQELGQVPFLPNQCLLLTGDPGQLQRLFALSRKFLKLKQTITICSKCRLLFFFYKSKGS